MIVMWFCLLVIWAYVIVWNGDISIIFWWLLFLLWVGLATHYAIIYRKWKKEMDFRTQIRIERKEQINVSGSQNQ